MKDERVLISQYIISADMDHTYFSDHLKKTFSYRKCSILMLTS